MSTNPGNPVNPSNGGKPDRRLIYLSRHYDVAYWTTMLGVSEDRLRAAVEAVGNSRYAVNFWLHDNR